MRTFQRYVRQHHVALLALFVALGGTSYAALRLPANSVGARQIKSNAVSSAKVLDRSLLATDFKAGQLPSGPQGPAGAAGAKGDPGTPGTTGPRGAAGATNVKVRLGNLASSTPFAISDAACLAGERATGGGSSPAGGANDSVYASAPTAAGPAGLLAAADATPTGWRAAVRDNAGGEATVQAYVVCAAP